MRRNPPKLRRVPGRTAAGPPSGPLALIGGLALLLASSACVTEIDRAGLLCSEQEPCDPPYECIQGRCGVTSTMVVDPILPAGRAGLAYRGVPRITGGDAPYRLEVTGALTGYIVSVDGDAFTITPPPEAGEYTFSAVVSDADLVTPERVELDFTVQVKGTPAVAGVEAVTVPDALGADSVEVAGNAVPFGDGGFALSMLRMRVVDGATQPEVAVHIGAADGSIERTITVSDPPLEVASLDPDTEIPLSVPRVFAAGDGALLLGYAAKNDDNSHSMAVTRIDPASGGQVSGTFDLNSGTCRALDVVELGGVVYAACVSVSISGDIVAATLEYPAMSVIAREAHPFTGVRGNESTGLELQVWQDAVWLMAASDTGGLLQELGSDADFVDVPIDLGTNEFLDVRAATVGSSLIQTWSVGVLGDSTAEYINRTPTAAEPGQDLITYTPTRLGRILGNVDLYSDGTEVAVVAMDTDGPQMVISGVDGEASRPVDTTLGSIAGSDLANERERPVVFRLPETGDYVVFWSENTNPDTGERKLYRMTTRDP